jgi:hypothetical protein
MLRLRLENEQLRRQQALMESERDSSSSLSRTPSVSPPGPVLEASREETRMQPPEPHTPGGSTAVEVDEDMTAVGDEGWGQGQG